MHPQPNPLNPPFPSTICTLGGFAYKPPPPPPQRSRLRSVEELCHFPSQLSLANQQQSARNAREKRKMTLRALQQGHILEARQMWTLIIHGFCFRYLTPPPPQPSKRKEWQKFISKISLECIIGSSGAFTHTHSNDGQGGRRALIDPSKLLAPFLWRPNSRDKRFRVSYLALG